MSAIDIEISTNAQAVLKDAGQLTARMQQEISGAINLQNELTKETITEKYLRGPRPQKLGVVTARLRQSIFVAPARATADEVISSIGTNVKYAGVHERGFKGMVTVRAHRRRIIAYDRYERVGRGLRQTQSGIKGNIKQHSRQMDMPARPFLGPAIADRTPYYGNAVSEAIVLAWNGGRG